MRSLCIGEKFTYVAFLLYIVASFTVVGLINWHAVIPLSAGYIILGTFVQVCPSIPLHTALEAFFLGSCPAVILVIVAEAGTQEYVLGTSLSDLTGKDLALSVISSFLIAFIMAALIEEMAKFVMMKIGVNTFTLTNQNQEFNLGDFKSIVLYSAIGALGFSTMETTKYVMVNSQISVVSLTFVRVICATTLHCSTGFYIGLSGTKSTAVRKLVSMNPETRIEWTENWVHALTFPVIMHGLYHFLSFLSNTLVNKAYRETETVSVVVQIPVFISLFIITPSLFLFVRRKYLDTMASAETVFSQAEAAEAQGLLRV